MTKNFSFIFPVMQGCIDSRDSRSYHYDHICDLVVKGVATDRGKEINQTGDRYSFDISEIIYEAVNVFPLLKAFEALGKIEAACLEHISNAFGEEDEFKMPEPISMNHGLAKVIALPLRRKVR